MGSTVDMDTVTYFRITKTPFQQAFANPEDATGVKGGKVIIGDPDVERVRRAHLNDIENILPFVILAAIFLTTAPSVGTAKLLFRVFTAARYIHTFVYLFAVNAMKVLREKPLVGLLLN